MVTKNVLAPGWGTLVTRNPFPAIINNSSPNGKNGVAIMEERAASI
jgi:hypothetical protein